jgi:phosphatidylglycerophosphatase C
VAVSAPEAGPSLDATGPRRIAAFDFDGTLTVRDTFSAFLQWRSPRWRLAVAGLRLAPAAVAYVATRDRGRFKTAAFHAVLGRVALAQLEAEAERFAEAEFARLLRPDALARWEAHGLAGDERVIVTASPEPIIAPFARRLGADRLIGTRLEVEADGRVDGALNGPNCRGPEKVARLQAVYGAGVRPLSAYGDTAGDVELLAIAEHPHMRLFRERPGA